MKLLPNSAFTGAVLCTALFSLTSFAGTAMASPLADSSTPEGEWTQSSLEPSGKSSLVDPDDEVTEDLTQSSDHQAEYAPRSSFAPVNGPENANPADDDVADDAVVGEEVQAGPQQGSAQHPMEVEDGTWVVDNGRWKYRNQDGTFLTSRWATIDADVYCFDASGFIRTGWYKEDGSWYRLAATGQRLGGWHTEEGIWYYLDPDSGEMITGPIMSGGAEYYLHPNGVMATGWVHHAHRWHFYSASGAGVRGWVSDRGMWYYLDPQTGVMQTGSITVDGADYYLQPTGEMATGWVQHSDGWRFYDLSGVKRTGWIQWRYSWYYLQPGSGVMLAGTTQVIDGQPHTFMPDGKWVG